jgi:hypothetical protein
MTRKNMAVTGIYLLHKSWCNIQKNDLNASCLATSETSSTLSRNRRVESYLTWAAQILFVVRGGEENKYLQFIKKKWFSSGNDNLYTLGFGWKQSNSGYAQRPTNVVC